MEAIIKSTDGNMIHPGISGPAFLIAIALGYGQQYIVAIMFLVLGIFILIAKKERKIDVVNRRVVSGSSGFNVIGDGYISIFKKQQGQRVQARGAMVNISENGIIVNYIDERNKRHLLYNAESKADAIAVATHLGEAWNMEVYDALAKEYIIER